MEIESRKEFYKDLYKCIDNYLQHYSDEYVETARKQTMYNRPAIEKSTNCACMYCGHIFPAADILNAPEPNGYWTIERNGIQTALCPSCKIDTILSDGMGYPVTDLNFIAACTHNWYNGYSPLEDVGFVKPIKYVGIVVD